MSLAEFLENREQGIGSCIALIVVIKNTFHPGR